VRRVWRFLIEEPAAFGGRQEPVVDLSLVEGVVAT
jgi:hypothetical protein